MTEREKFIIERRFLSSDPNERKARRRSSAVSLDGADFYDCISAPGDIALDFENADAAIRIDATVEEEGIIERQLDGASQAEIAREMGVDPYVVNRKLKSIRQRNEALRPDDVPGPREPARRPRARRRVNTPDQRELSARKHAAEQKRLDKRAKELNRLNLAGPRVLRSTDECPPCVLCMWWAGVTTMPPPGVHVDRAMLATKLAIARDSNRLGGEE